MKKIDSKPNRGVATQGINIFANSDSIGSSCHKEKSKKGVNKAPMEINKSL